MVCSVQVSIPIHPIIEQNEEHLEVDGNSSETAKKTLGFRELSPYQEGNGNSGLIFLIKKSENALFCTMGTLGIARDWPTPIPSPACAFFLGDP